LVYKQAKKFLDLLAISAGRKHPRPQRKHHPHSNNPSTYDITQKKDETFITAGEA
jgi:Asp-tRNA(Asn)/Glu-tRNA(Gln) amidotransferase B subunit